MPNLTRRTLLLSGAAATLAARIPARHPTARAAAIGRARNLIIVLAYGGWDTSYALDPKLPDGSTDIPEGSIVTHGGLDVFEHRSRPSVSDFFAKYAAQTAIIRGVKLKAVSHAACAQAMLTGARTETSADIAAITAQARSPELPIPYLVLGELAFAGPYAASMGRVGASNQLVSVLDPAAAYPVVGRPPPFEPTSRDESEIRTYTQARVARERAVRGATGYNKRRVDDFAASLERGERLRGLRAGLGTRGAALGLAAQRQLAIDAISTGVSRTVMMSSQATWDTHEQNHLQSGSHDFLFSNLLALVDGLAARAGSQAGTTMLDETCVAVISEMGRTPKLQGTGKHHWPVTSTLVIGAGVRGGRSYGGTTAAGEAQPTSFSTGEVSASGRTIEPRHLVAGLLELCGVDPQAYLPDAEAFDAFVA